MPHSSPELFIPASPAADAPPSTDVDISSMSQLRKNSGQTQFSKRPNYIEASNAPLAQRIISRDSQNEDENGSEKSKQPLSFAHWTRQALVHVLVSSLLIFGVNPVKIYVKSVMVNSSNHFGATFRPVSSFSRVGSTQCRAAPGSRTAPWLSGPHL